MDGFTLLKELQQLIQETTTSPWADPRSAFDYLYQASIATCSRTGVLTGTQSITTVSGTSSYTLNSNYIRMYLKDTNGRFIIKYTTAAGKVTFPHFVPYETIILGNYTSNVSVPNRFSITDATVASLITSTATSAGAKTNTYTIWNQTIGEATLTSSTSHFTGYANVGDPVNNVTDGSHGYIVALSSDTAVVTALFDGTDNDWTGSDVYIINPQLRFQIVLDPPPSASGDTVTVYYVKRDDPVYSVGRAYHLPSGYSPVLVHYAAWLYKYRDREPSFGDGFYRYWDHQCTVLENNMVNAKTGGVMLKHEMVAEELKKASALETQRAQAGMARNRR